MPNHVTNLVSFKGDQSQIEKLMASVKSGNRIFDFNYIIPMPECLEGYNPRSGIVETAVKNALGLPLDNEPIIAMLEKENRVRACFTEVNPEDITSIVMGIKNYQKCGHIYWHSWAVENWSTKWNGYDQEQRDDVIKFKTAWATPVKVFSALSAKFPEVEITVEYADENIGSNCGTLVFFGGLTKFKHCAPNWADQNQETRRKWVAFALKVNGSDQKVDEYFAEIAD